MLQSLYWHAAVRFTLAGRVYRAFPTYPRRCTAEEGVQPHLQPRRITDFYLHQLPHLTVFFALVASVVIEINSTPASNL